MGEERLDVLSATPRVHAGEKVPPPGEEGVGGEGGGEVGSVVDDGEHIVDLGPWVAGGVLGEPLGREVIGGDTAGGSAVDLGLDLEEDVGELCQGDDAVAKRQAGAEFVAVEAGAEEADHGRGGAGGGGRASGVEVVGVNGECGE